jgi:hypothetical protein
MPARRPRRSSGSTALIGIKRREMTCVLWFQTLPHRGRTHTSRPLRTRVAPQPQRRAQAPCSDYVPQRTSRCTDAWHSAHGCGCECDKAMIMPIRMA